MRRSIIIALVLACALLVVLACSHDTASLRSDTPLAPAIGTDKDTEVVVSDQTYLSELWALAESAEYDVITGTIDCATGGSFQGVPASWPPEYQDRIFGMEFPPGAWDPAVYGSTVTFRILVPRFDTVMPCCEAPMFFSLEADGFDHVVFTKPVKLTFSDHPSLDSWCGNDELFSYEFDPLSGAYFYTDHIVLPGLPQGDTRDPACGIARTTYITHFSKWGRKNSNSGTEGGFGGDMVQDHHICPDLNGGGSGPF